MALEIFTYRYLADNYGFVLHSATNNKTAAIDCGDGEKLLEVLHERGWRLDSMYITHHHGDHTAGIMAVKKKSKCQVFGPQGSNIDGIDTYLSGGDKISFAECPLEVIHTPGHTNDMLNYYFPGENAIFTGDTLFSMGCGKLFEAEGKVMWQSLQKFTQLPFDTKIYYGHEYTLANGKFALSIEPNNEELIERIKEAELLCSAGEFTVPSILQQEYATNPFLRVNQKVVRENLGMADRTDEEVFIELRNRKDKF